MSVVRRPTGGRVLLHDHEVTYSVTAPAKALVPEVSVNVLAVVPLITIDTFWMFVSVSVPLPINCVLFNV